MAHVTSSLIYRDGSIVVGTVEVDKTDLARALNAVFKDYGSHENLTSEELAEKIVAIFAQEHAR